jgi:nitrous oxidase accessory protein NosD
LAIAVSSIAAELHVPAEYPTIQAAVNAAQSNDIVRIAPGVYAEQIVIVRKDLTLAGAPGTVIRARTGMTATLASYVGPLAKGVALLVIANSRVAVSGLEFEGEHLADSYNGSLLGLWLFGSSGTVERCSFKGFRGTNDVERFAIALGVVTPLASGPVSVQIRNNTFMDNTAAAEIVGDPGFNPTARLTEFIFADNTITGIGPSDHGAQQGLRILCGASGVVRRNTITDHSHTAGVAPGNAIGIVAFDDNRFGTTNLMSLQPLRFEGNVFRNNQNHMVVMRGDGSVILNNQFEGSAPGARASGLVVSGKDVFVATNRFADVGTGVVVLGNDPDFGTMLGISTNVQLVANRFCDVTPLVLVEPLATGTTEIGSVTCPFSPPLLAIAPAVLLSWPGADDDWTVESATNAAGPWTASDATPFKQYGRNGIAVPTEGERRFFRLR